MDKFWAATTVTTVIICSRTVYCWNKLAASVIRSSVELARSCVAGWRPVGSLPSRRLSAAEITLASCGTIASPGAEDAVVIEDHVHGTLPTETAVPCR